MKRYFWFILAVIALLGAVYSFTKFDVFIGFVIIFVALAFMLIGIKKWSEPANRSASQESNEKNELL